MIKAKLLLLLAFVIVFAAGAVVGRVRELHPQPGSQTQPPLKHPHHGPGLVSLLNLSPAQGEQMKQIWDAFGKEREQIARQFPENDQDRDAAIQGLMTSEQWARYQEIQKQHEQRTHEIREQIQQAFQKADAATRGILSPDQVAILDKMQREHGGRMPMPGGRMPMPGGRRHHPDSRPVESPSTRPAELSH